MIRNFFYSQAKAVFKPPTSTRFKVQHTFELIITVFAFVRVINIILSVYWKLPFAQKVLGLPVAQAAWDPYSQVVYNHRDHFELFFLSVPIFWIMQAMIVNHTIYFQAGSRPISGGGFYELSGVNFETVAHAMLSPPCIKTAVKQRADLFLFESKYVPSFLGRFLGSCGSIDVILQKMTYYWMFYCGELVDLDNLRRGPRLKVFSTLSPVIRRRLFVISLLFDLFFFGFGCVVLIINLPLIVVHQTRMILANTSLGDESEGLPKTILSAFFFGLDLVFINLVTWIIFRDSMLMIHYVHLTVEAYRSHLKERNQILSSFTNLSSFKNQDVFQKLLKTSSSNPPPPLKLWQRHQLAHILSDHTRASMRIDVINSDFSSNITLVLLALHICINIIWSHRLIMVDRLLLYKADLFWPYEGSYILFIIVVQTCVIAIILFPFGRVNAEIYRTQKFLPKIVLRLDEGGRMGCRNDDIVLKLRLTEMCDRLGNAERKVGFSLGPKRVITYNVLFETLLFHIGYMMCFFNFLHNNEKH